MMTVQAIWEALAQDPVLADDYGLTPDKIFEIQSIDERPVHSGPFAVFKWEEMTSYTSSYSGSPTGIPRAPRTLQIWVHIPWDETREFDLIDKILNRIDYILSDMEHVPGTDGYTVTSVGLSGRSGNLRDEGFKTITRNGIYGVMYRETVPV